MAKYRSDFNPALLTIWLNELKLRVELEFELKSNS